MSKIYLSQDGYDSLKNELHKLKTIDRPNIINQIAEARDKGDLSENAEYDAAKDAQGLLELKINELEMVMSNARILDPSQLDNSEVRVLSKVTIMNKKNKIQIKNKTSKNHVKCKLKQCVQKTSKILIKGRQNHPQIAKI